MPNVPLAVQLFTLRDLTQKDFAGTMKEVAKIGYPAVELAGYGNLTSAAEVRKALDDAGLKLAGAHIGLDPLEKDLNKTLDEQAALGNKIVIVPHLGEDRRKSADGWKQVAQSLTRIGGACRERGMDFAYHNHAFEFQQFDGKTGLDILWENSDPDLVKSELDVYWVKKGGLDPTQYVQKLGKRILCLHLKDMDAGAEQRFAPIGTGTIDFKPIIAAGQQVGAKWQVVEQDRTYDTPSLEAVRISWENLKKLGAA